MSLSPPEIKIHTHPLSLVQDPDRLRSVQRGELIHLALFFLEHCTGREDIERAMTKGTNYPMGLLHWADEIGLGEVHARLAALFEVYGDDRYRPSPLLKLMARDGKAFFQ